ncbi:hypothetical protein FACS1894188_02550 [Clostridia bacterium]|nr:hypothetical protein FACS1894188_02550 [Clostridia bacterium]
MDGMQILLLVAVVVGIVLIIVVLAGAKDGGENSPVSYLETESVIRAIDVSVTEAEKMLDELNSFMNSAASELDTKYQELLFLYNLIDEKKSDIERLYANTAGTPAIMPTPAVPAQKTPQNPRHKEIMDLRSQGMSAMEISKLLNIGQGEVSLILQMR